jgi:hypothetical protein
MTWRWCGIGLLAIAASGCFDNDLGLEKRAPNRPPQTVLSGGPADFSASPYRVSLSWWGSDSDGTIDHFDFILVDHPAAVDSIQAGFVIDVPKPDDPRWLGTHATDSTFVTLADTLRQDPQGGPPADVLNRPFQRWHTFFVRAVDDEGLADPSPDYLSFNAVNRAPTVAIRRPVSPGLQFQSPPTVFLSWSGQDPLGDGGFQPPVASRWLVLPSAVDSRGKYLSWPDSVYTLPARFSWSPWHRWGNPDSSGVRALVTGLLSAGLTSQSGYYIFAVQAMDEAGAITPVFDTAAGGKNNAVLMRISQPAGPFLLVEDRFLGVYSFIGKVPPVPLDVATGQPIRFHWSGNAAQYGGEISGYRYGWNLLDPGNDAEWSSWSLTGVAAPTHTIAFGEHRFYLQARDNAGNVTSVMFELASHEVTRERDLLWVDDTASVVAHDEELEDLRWIGVFDAVAQAHGFAFDSEADVYDVSHHANAPPPIDYAFRYKAIVWSVRNGSRGASGLRTLAQFFDPFATRNRNRTIVFDYLNSYLQHDGKLWLNGFRPALQLWPVERTRGEEQNPVNVTNWDDPLTPHPLVDSVGTTSLVYEMGVEMFDVGAATGAARTSVPQFCRGLARAIPSGSETETFDSTQELGHTHVLGIPASLMAATGPDTVGLETSTAAEHRHRVRLAPEQLDALRAGATVRLTSEPAELPAPHVHEFEVHDRVGTWGAPALVTGTTWGFRSGEPGRPNIEIYNMPAALATQHPALVPLPGISTVLYTYVSDVSTSTGVTYPQTADGEAVCVLGKSTPSAPTYSTAICGFEPHLLVFPSHAQLAAFLLVRHFGLGTAVGPGDFRSPRTQ